MILILNKATCKSSILTSIKPNFNKIGKRWLTGRFGNEKNTHIQIFRAALIAEMSHAILKKFFIILLKK